MKKQILLEIEKLENVYYSNRFSDVNKLLAKYLLDAFNDKREIPAIKDLAKILNVSVSSISKFIKYSKLESFTILKYLWKIYSKSEDKFKESRTTNEKIRIFSSYIRNSNRILACGVSDSLALLHDLSTELTLLGKHMIYLEDSGDQIKMAEKLTENDLLVLISFQMRDLFKQNFLNSKAKKIIFTSQDFTSSAKDTYIFKVGNSFNAKFSNNTYQERIEVLKIIDELFKDVKARIEYQ